MTRLLLFVCLLMGFTTVNAQQPAPPPKPDIAPPPLPMEGQKRLTPGKIPKKGKKILGAEMPEKRPPVNPPTPEPTLPDEPHN
jgi:hypothetical protein